MKTTWLNINLAVLICFGLTSRANPIDSLKTKKDVADFLMLHIPEFKSGYTVTDDIYTNCDSSIFAELLYKGWDIIDFDGNGMNDLLVNGYDTSRREGDVLVLAYDDMHFTRKALSYHWYKGPHNYKGYYIDGVPVIFAIYGQYVPKNNDTTLVWRDETTDTCINFIDTLVYKFENLVEYNQEPKTYAIEELTYRTDTIGMSGEENYASINFMSKKNNASYSVWGHYYKVATISNKNIEIINNILNYIDFVRLNASYDCGMTDQRTTSLEIVYNGGKVKIISDYGQWGTYGLRAIYDLLENLDWK